MSSFERKYGPSPIYSWENPTTIAASGVEVVDYEIDIPKSQKYLPFDSLTVTNLSTAGSFKLYFNQDSAHFYAVPASTSFVFTPEDIPAFRSLKIVAGGSALSAGQVVLVAQKKGFDADTVAAKTARGLLG